MVLLASGYGYTPQRLLAKRLRETDTTLNRGRDAHGDSSQGIVDPALVTSIKSVYNDLLLSKAIVALGQDNVVPSLEQQTKLGKRCFNDFIVLDDFVGSHQPSGAAVR